MISSAEITELVGVKYKNEGPHIKKQEKKTEGVDNKGYKDEETDIKYNTTKASEKLKNYDDVNDDWMFADRLHKSAYKGLDPSDIIKNKHSDITLCGF